VQRHLLLAAVGCGLASLSFGQSFIVETIAGVYDVGDGGPATSALLVNPRGIAFDAAGNLIIADGGNHRVRRLTPGGVISTLAGDGFQGFTGDGGPANMARLNVPNDVAADAAGNVYIFDGLNVRVRRISPAGVMSTVAGTGVSGFGGDGGPATAARLGLTPFLNSVTTDSAGNLYVADTGNHRIRRVITASGVIVSIVGAGTAGFSGDGGQAATAQLFFPSGISFDAGGNLFIADAGNQRIRRVASAGLTSTVAGNGVRADAGDGGPALSASMSIPNDVALDAAGNIYIADSFNHRVRRVAAGTGVMTTIAGDGALGFSGDGGPATAARLRFPSGVAVDASGTIFIADNANDRIRTVSGGIIRTVAGSDHFRGDGGPASAARLFFPQDGTFDAAGNLYVA